MSSIEKLTVQGIRSFGANAEDKQSIVFTSPVTLILGENGCGKTTIIECLKYALTGEAPPGSDRGKNFVHDPKIFSLGDTLGQIKLLVRNIRNERRCVCRSMKISHRRGTSKLETLDSTMTYIKEGETDSISQRCIDVDVAMCEFMGVSKAIINNVLFCHQEDSSWPLDEPKKLKEKFDAIFGITEFNKAVEKIIKLRKVEMDDLKVKEANLRLLAHLKLEMEDKSMSLEKAEKKCDGVKEQCKNCDDEMKPIEQRLQEIRNIEFEVGKYQALKVELETKLKNCQEQISSLGKKIKKPFKGSVADLDNDLHAFHQKMLEKKSQRTELDGLLSKLNSQEKNIQKSLADLDKKHCIAEQNLKKEQECIAKRADKMKSLCNQFKIAFNGNSGNTREQVDEILEEIQNSMMSEQCEIAEKTAQFDNEDQQRQHEIDTMRVELTKLEENIIALQKQKTLNEKELQTAELKISDIELSTHRLKKITQEIERIDECYEDSSKKFNQEVLRKNIADGKVNITKMQTKFSTLDERLTFLTSISKQMAEISHKEKELEKKEQEVRRVKSKHGDNIKKLFTRSIESNFRRSLQNIYEKLRRDVKDLNEKINESKLKENSYEIQRKNLKEELVRSEKELEEAKEKIFEKCHSTPYKDLLLKCKAAVTKCQLDHGALRSAEAMYKKYMQKIEDDPCCPLCHKGMSSNETSDLTAELSDEIDQLPENIKRTEKALKAEQKKYEDLLHLKPIIDKTSHLEIELPKRKEELKNIQVKMTDCLNENESLQLLLAEPTINLDLANSMMGDMSLLDEALKEISRLKGDIEKLKKKLPQGSESDVSIEDIQLEKSTVAAELESERSKIEKLQQDYESAMDSLNKLREMKNTLKDEQIKLQEGVQSLPQLKERQLKLSQLVEVSVVEIQESQSKIQPLKQKLNSSIADKTRLKEANRKKVHELQTKHDSHKNIDHDIQRLNIEVNDYKKLNLDVEISQLKASIKKHKDDVANMSDQIAKAEKDLDGIKTDCLNQETLERDLKDNRELKLLEQKKQDLTEENEKLLKQLGNLDFRSVSREKNELVTKRDKATVRKGELLGQIGEINNQIKRLKKEIDEPQYKNSVHNYRKAYYDVEGTRQTIGDLGKNRMAMEWSLMKFHAEKMENINRLIREYWRLIYRGNDIDYIQIQTDDGSTATSADSRRNYNYRVIQSKNNSEIEMRGRCSAGQRVLASLIIRMALAETFSSNCGVLALDEPTTNLDRVNIRSLCDALNRIVDERQTQSNFMLVIITHDEDFISTLGKINSYHRVSRNDECKSVIRSVKVA